jgi:hypothetical protein
MIWDHHDHPKEGKFSWKWLRSLGV